MAITLGVSGAQRDARTTFLVDVSLSLHAPTTPLTLVAVEFSTTGMAGPWTAASAQTYDRRHTALASLGPIPAAPPDAVFDFVWNAFFDLAEDDYPALLVRATVTDGFVPVTVVSLPFDVSTVAPKVVDPLAAQIARRAAVSRAPTDFLGNGLVAPLERVSRDFRSAAGEDLVKACVGQALRIRAAVGAHFGDLPWRPDAGCKVWILRHRNKNSNLEALALAYVREALLYEPRVRVARVDIVREPFAGPSELRLRVLYRIIDENVAGNRVVLPVFTEEITLAA